ncbi:MAG: helix-turn-helix transcriptional regulator [Bacteroidales bacterium]|jgi:transcriptional regulator with XRE-family HTH domain|nr:helix-turn-helix domain-containing protein [Bacteroidales bacterium]MDD2831828.1 helix-turn-helix transcriptional regulator [Bacteroidales bacterium]MDD3209173.1 helix-turn-helix transcriptional regulator [Bacteroidales bacterium]MDD3697951.1 helix-turn-helix transcriptional regulator [Bacteroidales bacterium]MDD4168279.1 helix-turn-helix transcriptional regulator [Bacteroidales bacterium]
MVESNFKNMSLSEKLKELRLKANLPQRKVAAAIDVDTATYCKFEKGVLRISREQLLKYADFLKTDTDNLLSIWLADQMKKTVSEESKAVVNEAIKMVSNQYKI